MLEGNRRHSADRTMFFGDLFVVLIGSLYVWSHK